MSPISPNRSAPSTAPAAPSQEPERWDEEHDVVVLGYGGAGAAAAIEAAERGARTLVVERFEGGGATRLSGGVYYAGGGTPLQKAAGYDDTPEQLFAYLRCETDGEAVDDAVLREFSETSVENFEWLEARGVRFPAQDFAPIKTSYPSAETTLYFSGNEKSPPYRDEARPAPRGHRPIGPGLTGNLLFEPLRDAASAAGVRVAYRTRATRLITDTMGRVVGVEVRTLASSAWVVAIQRLLYYVATYGSVVLPPFLPAFKSMLERWEEANSTTRRIRARGGVVISTGGFIYNHEWTARYLPRYHKTMRLGTIGDDGSGIALGQAVGGAVRKMERGTAWMFINPPVATCKGLLVDRSGERVCNEELYGAALGEAIAEHHDGRAILLLDRRVWEETRDELFRGREAFFQSLTAVINLWLNNKKAHSLAAMEQKLGMREGTLEQAVARYNEGVEARKDECGKSTELLQVLDRAPFYAIDADIDNWKFLSPSISLGGLDVNGLSGAVRREDGTEIEGLYAAGRAAAGVCSQHYVSGLSIADCIFAGRNAGAEAARAVGNDGKYR